MNKVLIILGLALGLCGNLYAFEMGLILGEPTGLSAALEISGGRTLDLAAAWSFEDPASVHLHLDMLWNLDLLNPSRSAFATYGGIGIRFKAAEDEPRLGVRLPFGIKTQGRSLVLFMEIVPVLDLAPATVLRFNGGFGLRYRLI